jgi:hypothetical protein
MCIWLTIDFLAVSDSFLFLTTFQSNNTTPTDTNHTIELNRIPCHARPYRWRLGAYRKLQVGTNRIRGTYATL